MIIDIQKVLNGDIKTVAKLITDIDDDVPEVRDTLKALHKYTGKAYVIGVTGSPGVGKSTLVDRMVTHLRGQEKTVGILAVDPTSPFTGGAILGDRVRMQRHSTDKGVFIRSLATRGQFGGITASTRSAIDVLDAMGKDFIIVETVGVGQDEVDIVKRAQTTIVVLVPGMGDEIQAIKAGILEVGDIFAINKSDRDGAEKTENELRLMIEMGQKKDDLDKWKPPILRVEALGDKGVTELIEEIKIHQRHLEQLSDKGENMERRKDIIREDLKELIGGRLLREGLRRLEEHSDFEMTVEEVTKGEVDPYSACDKLLMSLLPSNKTVP